MRWTIEGANRETGKDIKFGVEAATQDEAIREAGRKGVLVTAATSQPGEPAPKLNVRNCPDCGGIVSRNATKCPHCGRVDANKAAFAIWSRILIYGAVAAFAGGIIYTIVKLR